MKHYILKHKYFIILVFFLLSKHKLLGQHNIVPNSSFEEYTICPNNYSIANQRANKPNIWYKPDTRGALYFNSCDTNPPYWGIPYNGFGGGGISYQYPRNGFAYVGLSYLNFGYHDYLQVKLFDSLIYNKKYYAEYYVNLSNVSNKGCNNIGILFTNNVVYADTINKSLLLANPQILGFGNPIVTDTMGWVKISGIFTAQGGEQYLTLGNFKSKANTLTKTIQTGAYDGAGYYVDDVSVYEINDSFCLKADAGKDTTIKLGDSVFIGSYTNGIVTLRWLQGSTVIDSTRPGFWVKPTTATNYVLCQLVNGCATCDTINISIALPLKFTSFTCIPSLRGTKQSVHLNWSTANEIDVSHFNIQRSNNAKDFSTINTVKANNKSTNEYSIVDNSPPVEGSGVVGLGVVYYRIESIDLNGAKQYSQTKQINFSTNQQINIYPNPAKETINISSKETIKEIKLINQLGQIILQQTFKIPMKSTTLSKTYPKGIYIIQITNSNSNIHTKKIIIE